MTINLNKFLVNANLNGYASESTSTVTEKDGSTSILYESGEWRMHDNYFGGEPFGGREIVFYQGKPHWIMVYYGRVEAGQDMKLIYPFLKEALSSMPEDKPFRGPDKFTKNNMIYTNKVSGTVKNFKGEEIIYIDNKECYCTNYSGGFVDLIQE